MKKIHKTNFYVQSKDWTGTGLSDCFQDNREWSICWSDLWCFCSCWSSDNMQSFLEIEIPNWLN